MNARVPTLIEVAAEDAEAIVDGIATETFAGMEAAGAAVWKTAVDLASPAIEGFVRRALMPVHARRMSALRVQDAVKAEAKLLAPPSPRQREADPVEFSRSGLRFPYLVDHSRGRDCLRVTRCRASKVYPRCWEVEAVDKLPYR